MSISDNTGITDDAAAQQDDSAARQAAQVAVELSESGGPPDTRRLARGLRAVADRASAAVTAATATARRGTATAAHRGTEGARKGAAGASRGARRGAGSAGRGLSSGMSWLTGQAVAMGPRLRIRDQATLRAQFPGLTDDAIAGAADRPGDAGGGGGRRYHGRLGRAACAPRLPRGDSRGDACHRGDRGQACRGTARDLRDGRHRQPQPSVPAPTSDPGLPAGACTGWRADCCLWQDRRWPGSSPAALPPGFAGRRSRSPRFSPARWPAR